jgi:hypothetical protein
MEDSNNSDTYNALVKISQGREISNWELSSIDDIIESVRFNSSSPGKSRVKIRFNQEDDYWKLFDLNNDDIWFARLVHSNYDSYTFEDEYYTREQWNDGYLLREFDTDNLEKVKDILKLIAPKYHKLSTDDDAQKSAVLIENLFSDEVTDIIRDYNNEMNRCKEKGAREMIKSETCEVFQNYGIYSLGSCYYTYITTVSTLLSLYEMFGKKSMTIYEVLQTLGHQISSVYGNWYEYSYEIDCLNLDNESFNREVSWQLEKIMDKIIENDNFANIEKSSEKVSKILKKYDINTWYPLPKKPNTSFSILDFDLEEETILIAYRKENKNFEKRNYFLDDFYGFLYQHELF